MYMYYLQGAHKGQKPSCNSLVFFVLWIPDQQSNTRRGSQNSKKQYKTQIRDKQSNTRRVFSLGVLSNSCGSPLDF